MLTCIDARIDPARALGLDIGDAHVIRNAGGRATDDAVAEIIGDRCGEDVSHLDFLTFRDLDQSVRDDVDRVRSLSQIPADATVSGHVYDVRTGTLREVIPAE